MGRPRKTEIDSQKEIKTDQEVKKQRKASPKTKISDDASGFRTTIPPEHVYKLKMNTSQGEQVIITKNVSQIVDAIKKAKQDSKNIKIDPDKVIKINPRMVRENFNSEVELKIKVYLENKTGKSILHKLKDAILSFFRGFKK